jgi:rhodanese-related sulfurtransferase
MLGGATLAACSGAARQDGAALVFPEDALEAADAGDAMLVDVRLAQERRDVRLAGGGAVAIPFDPADPAPFIRRVAEHAGGDRSRELLLICEIGVRSQQARRALAAEGFSRVRSVDQGYGGWRAAGLPLRAPE